MIRINLLRTSQNLPVRYQPSVPLEQLPKTEQAKAIQPVSEKPIPSLPQTIGLNLYSWMAEIPVASSLLLTGLAGWLGGFYLAIPVLILSFLFVYVPELRYMPIGETEKEREKEVKELSERAASLKDRVIWSLMSFDPAAPPDTQLQTDLSELGKAFEKLEVMQKRLGRMRKNLVFQARLKANILGPQDLKLERHFQHVSEKLEQLRRFFDDLSRKQPSLGIYRLGSGRNSEPKKLPPAKIEK